MHHIVEEMHTRRWPFEIPSRCEGYLPSGSLKMTPLVAAAIQAYAIARVAARVRAASQARSAGSGIGQATVASRLAVVDRGAGARVGAEPLAAVRAGRCLGARGRAGITCASAGHATVAGGAATVATADQAVHTGRIIATGTAKARAAIRRCFPRRQPGTTDRHQASSHQSAQGRTS